MTNFNDMAHDDDHTNMTLEYCGMALDDTSNTQE